MTQQWCVCGSLNALLDAKGQTTRWERDVQNRVTREVRADGTTATQYTYELTTSRLKTVTDPKGQITTYTYHADDALQQMAFTNAVIPTPSVSYTYDVNYPQVVTMVDGTGTTAYTYKAPGVVGAGQVASVDGPLPDDTITYGYDQLGRVTSRLINGVGMTQAFDALGRVETETNVLGTFTYGYVAQTGRLASVSYPNGQTSAYSYFDNLGDHRLQTIHHKYPSGATLSKFDYTYDVAGNIRTWRQQADAEAMLWRYGYDAADQLTSAVKESTDPTPVVLKRYAYGYDPAGNRRFEQIDDAVTTWTYDALNRLVTQHGGGDLRFAGTVSEPATVTVAGLPATVSGANAFSAAVPTTVGTNRVTITATDPSGNTATATYEIDITENAKSFIYDANGNLTSDGTRTFEWDARNQLVAVTIGTHRSEFTYDGKGRRMRATEIERGNTVTDRRYVWAKLAIAEERDLAGNVIGRFTDQGLQRTSNLFFVHDHLASVRVVTDNSGAVTRYDYDPFGRSVTAAGLLGFTGHVNHTPSNLVLAPYRAYVPEYGRWLNEDPAGLREGLNLYTYVESSPIRAIDPYGLQLTNTGPPPSSAAPVGCSASAWEYLGKHNMRTERRQWRLLYAEASEVGTEEGHGPGPWCCCEWRLVGIIQTNQYVFNWGRNVTCCNASNRQITRTYGPKNSITIPVLREDEKTCAPSMFGPFGSWCPCREPPF